MAERALNGPLFYRGYFNHRSVRSEELTREQRIQYRGLYRRLYKKARGNYTEVMKARAMIRTMLYADCGEKAPRS